MIANGCSMSCVSRCITIYKAANAFPLGSLALHTAGPGCRLCLALNDMAVHYMDTIPLCPKIPEGSRNSFLWLWRCGLPPKFENSQRSGSSETFGGSKGEKGSEQGRTCAHRGRWAWHDRERAPCVSSRGIEQSYLSVHLVWVWLE